MTIKEKTLLMRYLRGGIYFCEEFFPDFAGLRGTSILLLFTSSGFNFIWTPEA
jgi:hypothetical protein